MTKEFAFFRKTEEMLNILASEKGVKNLEKYYRLTDIAEGSFLNKYEGISQVFAQMAFHAQNATLISNIVRFEHNLAFLDDVLCGFDPKTFLEKYPEDNRDASVNRIVEDLRYDPAAGKGLKWNSSKSKEENKDAIMKRYANSLLDCAAYLNRFHSRQDFLEDLKNHYKNKDYKTLIEYFRNNVQSGFSVALTCDFLKEFDAAFCDLPKPDIHIKDTLCALKGRNYGYYNNKTREYACIGEMQEITAEINRSLKDANRKPITVYQLDRMIWLICSGNFYLDNIADAKSKYLIAVGSLGESGNKSE